MDSKAYADYDYWIRKGTEFLNDVNTHAQALFAFNKAIRINRKSATAWAFKAYIFFFRGFHAERASDLIQLASSLEPENPIVLFYKAYKLHWDGKQLLEPLELVERALEKSPNLALAWVLKADIFEKLNWLEESLMAFNRAIFLGIKNSFPHGHKGDVLLSLNRYQEAIEAYDMAISRNPNFFGWPAGKGIALAKLGRYEKAIEMYDKAIQMITIDETIYYNKGIALMMLKRYEEALQLFDKTIEMNPNYAPAWNNKSWIFRKLGRYKEAKKASERAVEIDPEMVNPDYCTARDAAMQGNKASALVYLMRVSKNIPDIEEKMKGDPAFKDFWEH
jgi:tetratricopeptide (TPR) repeat protein